MAISDRTLAALEQLPAGSKVKLRLEDGSEAEGTIKTVDADAVSLQDRDKPVDVSVIETVELDIGTDGIE